MNTVFAKAPLRMALAGGGTDLYPYFKKHGGAVLNATIDQYAYCKIEPSNKNNIWTFKSLDLGIEEEIVLDENGDIHDLESNRRIPFTESKLKLLINTYQFITKKQSGRKPVKITTYVEAPPGSGLGSSSALVVSICAALSEYYNLPMGEYDMAKLAVSIERGICNLPGGKQDQYAAAFGGFNFIEFTKEDQVIVNPLRLNSRIQNLMELNTVLYYVGKPRKNVNVIENTAVGLNKDDPKVIDATHAIKQACLDYKNCLLVGDFWGVAALMEEYWEKKLETNKEVASPEILSAYKFALANGASAAKISGAGGGGHMVLFTDYDKRNKLISALNRRGSRWFGGCGRVVPYKFVNHGVDVWRQ